MHVSDEHIFTPLTPMTLQEGMIPVNLVISLEAVILLDEGKREL